MCMQTISEAPECTAPSGGSNRRNMSSICTLDFLWADNEDSAQGTAEHQGDEHRERSDGYASFLRINTKHEHKLHCTVRKTSRKQPRGMTYQTSKPSTQIKQPPNQRNIPPSLLRPWVANQHSSLTRPQQTRKNSPTPHQPQPKIPHYCRACSSTDCSHTSYNPHHPMQRKLGTQSWLRWGRK
jgi:hypothetical protein